MPVNGTGRKYLSDLLKGTDDFHYDSAVRFNYDTVDVGGTGEVDNIGIPLIWVNGNSRFEVYVAQDITAVTGSPLPGGRPICIGVGDALGLGRNREDTDLSVAGTQMTVLFRGDAAVVESGMIWGTANTTNQAEFRAQMEVQGVTFIDNGTAVTPAYTS